MVTYRTDGAWGSGIGRNLMPAEVDGNFYEHDGRITALEQNPPQAVSIDHIAQNGADLTFYMTDGTTQGPFTIPVTAWRFTGLWQPNRLYAAGDIFTYQGAIYLALLGFSAGQTFDPDVLVGGDPALQLILAAPALPYDLGFFYPLAIPGDGSVLGQYVIARDAYIPANFARSSAFLETACTAIQVFGIVLNEIPIGSITFTPGQYLENNGAGPGQWGVLTMFQSQTVTLALQDIIKLVAPSNTACGDATALGLSVTLGAATVGFGNASGAGFPAPALEDDSDVTVTSPQDGQALTYDAISGTWKNKTLANALAGLTDVHLSALSDGQLVTWNATTGRWENKAPAFSQTLAGDTDVSITSPADGDVLKYDGTAHKWKNAALGVADTDTLAANTDVNISSPADKQVLVYDLASGKWKNIWLSEAYLTFSDITTLNVNTSQHGLCPKLDGNAAHYLDGSGNWSTPAGSGGSSTLAGDTDVSMGSPGDRQALIYHSSDSKWHNDSVKDSDLSLSDVTTNNVSTSKHGFVPKAPNDTSKFLRGDGTWATVSAGSPTNFVGEATLTAPPTIAGGTLTNLGTGLTTADFTVGGITGIRLSQSGAGGNTNKLFGVYKAKPGTTWSLIARLRFHGPWGAFFHYGLLLYESATTKGMLFGPSWDIGLGYTTFTSPTSWNFDHNMMGASANTGILGWNDVWLRIDRTATPTYDCYVSRDGNAWSKAQGLTLTGGSGTGAAFTTEADNVGVGFNNNYPGTQTLYVDCHSFSCA